FFSNTTPFQPVSSSSPPNFWMPLSMQKEVWTTALTEEPSYNKVKFIEGKRTILHYAQENPVKQEPHNEKNREDTNKYSSKQRTTDY
ncbi:Protein of unknown function, partial [Gryllus bimaculatus]